MVAVPVSAVPVSAALAGLVSGFIMSADQRQQAPFGTTGLIIRRVLRRRECLGEIEGNMHRHQRVDSERNEAEPCGPWLASPSPRSHSGVPATVLVVPRKLNGRLEPSATG